MAYDYTENLSTPGERALPVTLNQVLKDFPKAIYVGVGGDITMQGKDGNQDVLWKNVQGGTILPFRPKVIKSAGTTATNLLLIY